MSDSSEATESVAAPNLSAPSSTAKDHEPYFFYGDAVAARTAGHFVLEYPVNEADDLEPLFHVLVLVCRATRASSTMCVLWSTCLGPLRHETRTRAEALLRRGPGVSRGGWVIPQRTVGMASSSRK